MSTSSQSTTSTAESVHPQLELPARSFDSDEVYNHTMRSRIPVAHRALALTAVLVPVTLLPYLLMRRNIRSIRRHVVTLTESDAQTRLAMKIHIDEVRMLQNRVQTMEDSVSELERRMVGTAKESTTQAELRRLQTKLVETRTISDAQIKTLSSQAGQNFADIATFINEAELSSKGLPAQASRIERIRQLAFRMYRA